MKIPAAPINNTVIKKHHTRHFGKQIIDGLGERFWRRSNSEDFGILCVFRKIRCEELR
jgi:hypothetical protein